MKVLQINAVYGFQSTGTIVKYLRELCIANDIECYVAFPKGEGMSDKHTYSIGCKFDRKVHAFLSRIAGRQAYFSHFATARLIKYIDSVNPDIIHLHNLHNNYINLNMLLRYISKKDIMTVVTMHDCWYFTGGCSHFSLVQCDKYTECCNKCSNRYNGTPALLVDASKDIYLDRMHYLSSINKLFMIGASNWITEECKKTILNQSARIYCIHNGFDLSTFKHSDNNMKFDMNLSNYKIILGPASKWLMPINKQTLDYFTNNLPNDCVLVLFGCETNNANLPRNVITIGYVKDKKQMAELYSSSDVLVNCSREDTLSSLNIEAQACGLPVVSYDATGLKETVDGIISKTVLSGDYKSLFLETINLMKHTYSYDEISRYVTDNFSFDNFKQYIKLYKSNITNGK